METRSRPREGESRFTPADIEGVPEVDALLARLGLGSFDRDSVKSAKGRNENWTGHTAGGAEVFVKQITGPERDARVRHTTAFCAAAGDRVRMPRLIGSDDEHGLLVFEYVPHARSGAELAAEDAFDAKLCERAGAAMAAVHGLAEDGFDTSPHPLPPLESLEAVSYAFYTQATAAELATWRLLHGDAELIRALRELRASDTEDVPSRCPVHGDMRLDQFLLAGEELLLTDFEEARIADPARDVGAFAGEWLFQAALNIPTTLSDASPMGHSATHEEIVATGVGEIEQRSPLVRAFFGAYLEHAPAAVGEDKELPTRAAAYAGWHMMDRMLATAGSSSRLSAVTKAAAGIGRTVLMSPAEFTSSLGLEA